MSTSTHIIRRNGGPVSSTGSHSGIGVDASDDQPKVNISGTKRTLVAYDASAVGAEVVQTEGGYIRIIVGGETKYLQLFDAIV